MTKSRGNKWSFSRINTFDNCPYEFELLYLRGTEGEQNVFAEFGSFVHKILEMYYKGELTEFDLTNYYAEHYKENVVSPFPKFISGDKYYSDGLKYLSEFTSVNDEYEVLGVEKFITTEIDGEQFVGIIDLLLKDKKTGGPVVYDHKSKGEFKSKKELAHYLRQLYLYTHWVYENYGVFPTKLVFNLFRKNEKIECDFDEEEYENTLKWFKDKIAEIKSTKEFKEKDVADFYCKNLCSCRNFCEKGLE